MRKQDYGFRSLRRMAAAGYLEKNILPAGSRFVTTGDFESEAKNHCAAVCATNLVTYALQKNPNLTKGTPFAEKDGKHTLFMALHHAIGNGPVLFFDTKLRRFFDNGFGKRYGLRMQSQAVHGFEEIKRALDADCPCVLLLANDLFHWHWVLAVGYRIYEGQDYLETGEMTVMEPGEYLRIADSWRHQADTFYRIGKGSVLLLARAYVFQPDGGDR
ncbi:MAG: hypothetical protein J5935_00285 [Lachnospiraceae bacterium]|nr:hypothetical protein [Lachnospiraceae bacterium]